MNLMAAYRLAVRDGAALPPAREAPAIPQQYIDAAGARYAAVQQEQTMGGVIMYDSTNPGDIPLSAPLVASYVDGYGGYSAAVSRFGASRVVSVSVGNNDADVADVEPGAMTTAELPGWTARQRARGISRPVLYSDGSQYPSVLAAGGGSCSYWTANPTGVVAQALAGRDAVQSVFGSSYDQSWVLPSFPFFPGGTVTTPTAAPWPLSSGSTGAYVVTLQQNLNRWAAVTGLTVPLSADGDFGPKTLAAVKLALAHWDYSAANVAAGIVDEDLWKYLSAAVITLPAPVVITPPVPPAVKTVSSVTVTFTDGTSVSYT